MHRFSFFCLCVAIAVLLTGCVHQPEDAENPKPVFEKSMEEETDPFEWWNRVFFTFNDAFDTLAFQPASKTYQLLVPPPLRQGLSNVLENALLPLSMINWLLQGNLSGAKRALWRFCVNTILGIGGVFQIIPEAQEAPSLSSFSKTLFAWGVEPGPYVVLPFLGPATFRDTVGFVVDVFLDPLNVALFATKKRRVVSVRNWVYFFDQKTYYMETLRGIKKGALDPYRAIRSLYLQSTSGESDLNLEEGPAPSCE